MNEIRACHDGVHDVADGLAHSVGVARQRLRQEDDRRGAEHREAALEEPARSDSPRAFCCEASRSLISGNGVEGPVQLPQQIREAHRRERALDEHIRRALRELI